MKKAKKLISVKKLQIQDTSEMNTSSDSTNYSPHTQTPLSPNTDNFVININSVLIGSDTRTTCMIRNIPNKYT